VNAKPLPEGFRYSSDSNERWLTRRELEELVTPETSAADRRCLMYPIQRASTHPSCRGLQTAEGRSQPRRPKHGCEDLLWRELPAPLRVRFPGRRGVATGSKTASVAVARDKASVTAVTLTDMNRRQKDTISDKLFLARCSLPRSMLSVTLPSIDLIRIGHRPSRHRQPVCTFSILPALPACADVPSEDIPFAAAKHSNTPIFLLPRQPYRFLFHNLARQPLAAKARLNDSSSTVTSLQHTDIASCIILQCQEVLQVR
jgi:hypothetical protein